MDSNYTRGEQCKAARRKTVAQSRSFILRYFPWFALLWDGTPPKGANSWKSMNPRYKFCRKQLPNLQSEQTGTGNLKGTGRRACFVPLLAEIIHVYLQR
jgi:hypothetical protein